jgi:hypothetical protein
VRNDELGMSLVFVLRQLNIRHEITGDIAARVENPHFRRLGRRLVFEWLSLAKITDRFGIEPQGIAQSSIKFWGVVHRHGLGRPRVRFGDRGRPSQTRSSSATTP